MQRIFVLFFAMLAVVSCRWALPDAGAFVAPDIADVTVDAVSDHGAMLVATVTDGTQVSSCGFVIVEAGASEGKEFAAKQDLDVFTCKLEDLKPSCDYNGTAFIRNGAGFRRDSPVFSFTTLPQKDFPVSSPVTIPDQAFLSWLLLFFDEDADGNLSADEASKVDVIELNTDNIASVEPLEAFPGLRRLHAAGTRKGDEGMGLLTYVDAALNGELVQLYVPHNRIGSVVLPRETGALDYLALSFNRLSEIDLRAYRALTLVQLDNNRFSSLDFSGMDKLDELHVECNPLTSITLDNKALRYIDLHGTNLTTVDFSRCPRLNVADCTDCPGLAEIVLAKGQVINTLSTDSGVKIIYNDRH